MERIKIEENKKTAQIEPVFEQESPKESASDESEKIEEIRQKIDSLKNSPKTSSINRLAGKLPEEVKQEILKDFENVFLNQDSARYKNERKKTQTELQIISLVNQATNEILQKYGLPDFIVPEKNTHLVWNEHWKKSRKSGRYDVEYQDIILQDNKKTLSSFLLQNFHENLHFKSYNSIQATPKQTLAFYRTGFLMKTRDGKKILFRNLNEAVTEEMTKKYGSKLLDNPLFEDEQVQTKAIKARYKNDSVFDDIYFTKKKNMRSLFNLFFRHPLKKPKHTDIYYESFVYQEERQTLKTLIDKLFARNPEKFENVEEITEMFERAMMTGHIHAVGQLIDKTFGKETFRKIGELGENTKGLAEFVDEL